MFNLEESKWEITESASFGLNALEIATKGGYVFLKHSETSESILLRFAGAGVGIGTPNVKQKPQGLKKWFNAGVAPPHIPRAKILYRFPMAGDKLTVDELKGPFLMLDCGANVAVGGNIFAMYFLGKAAAGLASNPGTFPLAIYAANGAIFSAGFTLTGGKGFTATVTTGWVSVEPAPREGGIEYVG